MNTKPSRLYPHACSLFLGLCVLGLTLGVAPAEDPSKGYVAAIEKAQGAADYRAKRALEADIVVNFGGNTVLEGRMLFDTPVGKARMELKGGVVIVFDGDKCWVTPADSELLPQARFHALTWPYFLAAPFKLSDPGAHVKHMGPADLLNTTHDTAKLTFDAGVGDAPDDWYVLYKEPGTDRLKAMAYIVTYSKSKEEAESEPHAVVFDGYQTIDGVTLPMTWAFYDWNQEKGVHGQAIGRVTVSNARFVDPPADAFTKPAGAAESKLPGE